MARPNKIQHHDPVDPSGFIAISSHWPRLWAVSYLGCRLLNRTRKPSEKWRGQPVFLHATLHAGPRSVAKHVHRQNEARVFAEVAQDAVRAGWYARYDPVRLRITVPQLDGDELSTDGYPRGAIIGLCRLTWHVNPAHTVDALDEWAQLPVAAQNSRAWAKPGEYGFVLSELVLLPRAISVQGWARPWDVSVEIAQQVWDECPEARELMGAPRLRLPCKEGE